MPADASLPLLALRELLRSMNPVLNDGVFVFATVPDGADLAGVPVLGTFREPEGLSLIVPEAEVERAGLRALYRAAWITLSVHSDLEAVGLTAAVATALTAAGISCNVVAAACHDHLFVPAERARDALACLLALQAGAETVNAPHPGV